MINMKKNQRLAVYTSYIIDFDHNIHKYSKILYLRR